MGSRAWLSEERIRIGTEGGLVKVNWLCLAHHSSFPWFWHWSWSRHLKAEDQDDKNTRHLISMKQQNGRYKERSAPQNDSSHPPLIQTSPIASWDLSVQAKSALQLTVNFWVAAVWKVPWAFISQLVRRHELCNVTTPLCLISSQLRYTHKSLPLVASCWRIAPLRWIFAHLYSILFSSTDWGKGHK